MKLTSIPQYKRNGKRFEQIVRILVKYGLADWLKPNDPEFITRLLTGAGGGDLTAMTRAERIREALTELGTTFIKMGQMLSTRSDIVGPELAEELAKLQAGTPADSPEQVKETIEKALGAAPDKLFARFNEEPMASASIAQAHLAELPDGTAVVVKVQHQGIEEKVVNDLEILIALAEIAEEYSTELALYQPVATLAEFRRNLLAELDFGQEEQNLLRFRANFAKDPTVKIPEVFPDFSARRVLTMARLEGFSIADTGRIKSTHLDPRLLAERGCHLYLEMIFRDRIYHADPHPGNILALPDNVIGLLDFGMVGTLDDRTSECIEDLIHGFLLKDGEMLTDCCLKIGYAPPDINRDELQSGIETFIAANLSGSIKDLEISHALNGLVDLIRRHRIVQRPRVSLLIKVLVMLEGSGRLLDPAFNLSELLEPYYKKMVKRRLSPENIFRRIQRTYRDWDQLAQSLPRDLSDIIERVRKGTLDVHLEHRKLDTVVNRLVFGVLAAAIFLGSSVLWSQQIAPAPFGVSIPGIAGVLFSLVLSFRLFRAIKKSGGL